MLGSNCITHPSVSKARGRELLNPPIEDLDLLRISKFDNGLGYTNRTNHMFGHETTNNQQDISNKIGTSLPPRCA